MKSRANPTDSEAVRFNGVTITINYFGIYPLMVGVGENETPEEYVEKVKRYLLPHETIEFTGDTINIRSTHEVYYFD